MLAVEHLPGVDTPPAPRWESDAFQRTQVLINKLADFGQGLSTACGKELLVPPEQRQC